MLASRTPVPRRGRRGAALPLALVMLSVLMLIAGGAWGMSRQTYRGGRNALVEQRALAVAEFGLNQRYANWPTQLNLPAGAGGLNVGGVDSTAVFVAQGDTARVRITRLDSVLFLVESRGRASIPTPMVQSSRSVASLVRLAYPTVNPRGALTVAGDVTLQGSALVDGRDRLPWSGTSAQWDSASCAGLRGPDTWAVAVPPSARVNDRPQNYGGTMTVTYDPLASDSNTYVRYGTESWETLVANANIRLPGSGYNDIEPTLRNGDCDVANQFNWGEPFGGNPATEACRDYFPIVYFSGSTRLNGRGRGQGILLVNGDLEINGNFDWAGLIIVRDDVSRGNGAARITGAVLARNVDLRDPTTVTGNQSVFYSRCAVESALRGSAILIPVRDRAWAQLY